MSSTNSTALADVNESRAPQGLAIVFVCTAIALILVALRLYTRVFLLKRVFCEDYAIVAAMVGLEFLRLHSGAASRRGSRLGPDLGLMELSGLFRHLTGHFCHHVGVHGDW